MSSRLKERVLITLRVVANKAASFRLSRNAELWGELKAYLGKTNSTGCNMTDYEELYRQVRRRKPAEVLECGTGVSTLVIAHALLENGQEGRPGRVTSLEESPEFFETAQRLLPDRYRKVVDLRHSPTVEDRYLMFRGVRYRDIPERDYEFVFIDGPSYVAPSDGSLTFDFDLIHVVKHARVPVFGLCDKRVSTVYVLQQIFGRSKVSYDAIKHLGFVGPCTAVDLRGFKATAPSEAFTDSFKIAGNSVLSLRLNEPRDLA
jgi:hypothetical protein